MSFAFPSVTVPGLFYAPYTPQKLTDAVLYRIPSPQSTVVGWFLSFRCQLKCYLLEVSYLTSYRENNYSSVIHLSLSHTTTFLYKKLTTIKIRSFIMHVLLYVCPIYKTFSLTIVFIVEISGSQLMFSKYV